MRYGLADSPTNPTTIVKWLEIPTEGQVFIVHPVNGGMAVNVNDPSLDTYMTDSGYYLWVKPIPGVYQGIGDYSFSSGEVTKELVNWTQEEIDAFILKQKKDLIQYSKDKAGALIGEELPITRQLNYLATAVKLIAKLVDTKALQKKSGNLTVEESLMLDYLNNSYDVIVEPTRDISNIIERDISDGLITTEDQIDTDPRWTV